MFVLWGKSLKQFLNVLNTILMEISVENVRKLSNSQETIWCVFKRLVNALNTINQLPNLPQISFAFNVINIITFKVTSVFKVQWKIVKFMKLQPTSAKNAKMNTLSPLTNAKNIPLWTTVKSTTQSIKESARSATTTIRVWTWLTSVKKLIKLKIVKFIQKNRFVGSAKKDTI